MADLFDNPMGLMGLSNRSAMQSSCAEKKGRRKRVLPRRRRFRQAGGAQGTPRTLRARWSPMKSAKHMAAIVVAAGRGGKHP